MDDHPLGRAIIYAQECDVLSLNKSYNTTKLAAPTAT